MNNPTPILTATLPYAETMAAIECASAFAMHRTEGGMFEVVIYSYHQEVAQE